MAAIQDIFGSQVDFGGSWILDGAVLTIGDKGENLITNSCTINYTRPLNKIIPLNTPKQFMVAGRGSGTITLGMIVGPSEGIDTFITQFRDPCKISENVLTLKATGGGLCDGGQSLEFKASWCLLQGMQASVQQGDMAMVTAGMTLVIGALTIKSDTSPAYKVGTQAGTDVKATGGPAAAAIAARAAATA